MAQERAKPIELELLCKKLEQDYLNKIQGVGNNEIAKRRNFLSKAIAAFVLHEKATANIEEAVSASIDGSFDHGIDSVFIGTDDVIWLIQSKYIETGFGEPELGEVSKFRDGVVDLLHGKFDRFNQALINKKRQIDNALKSSVCRVKAILAYSGTAISDDKRNIFSDIERMFNNSSPEFIRCYAYGLSTLHEFHASYLLNEKINEEIELFNFGYVQEPYEAFYGQMDAGKLAELWKKHKHNLVEKNIRRFKGETVVNQSLCKTLKDNHENFFYFNNGVTFLCDSISEISYRKPNREIGSFEVNGLSIINGAQTVGVIGSKPIEYYQQYPVRIFATFLCLKNTPDSFSIEVTQARNRQNSIDLEDFASLDDNQVRIKNALDLAGITYLIKQGYDDPPSSDTCFSIRELVPFLACTVTGNNWQEYVIAAKANKKRLFRQIGLSSHHEKMKDAYQRLFPDSRTAKEIWRIIQISRFVMTTVKERAKGEVINNNVSIQADKILLHGAWFILHIIFIKTNLQYGDCFSINNTEKNNLSVLIDEISNSLVNIIQSEQWGKSAQAIFENQTDCDALKTRLMKELA